VVLLDWLNYSLISDPVGQPHLPSVGYEAVGGNSRPGTHFLAVENI
jgi:hypothetical protein